jgi:hypothetical protein
VFRDCRLHKIGPSSGGAECLLIRLTHSLGHIALLRSSSRIFRAVSINIRSSGANARLLAAGAVSVVSNRV